MQECLQIFGTLCAVTTSSAERTTYAISAEKHIFSSATNDPVALKLAAALTKEQIRPTGYRKSEPGPSRAVDLPNHRI